MTVETITVDLPELYKYKLQVLQHKVADAKAVLVKPLQDHYSNLLKQAVDKVLKNDANYQAAEKDFAAGAEEAAKVVKEGLPENAVITSITLDSGKVTAELRKEEPPTS